MLPAPSTLSTLATLPPPLGYSHVAVVRRATLLLAGQVPLNPGATLSGDADIHRVPLIRDRYVNRAAPPSSTLVFAKWLVQAGWLMEVEAVVDIVPHDAATT